MRTKPSDASNPSSRRTNTVRAYLGVACRVLGILALTLGLLLAYASRALFNSDAFADRVAASLANPGVAALVADRVTEALIAQERDLTPFGPLLVGTTRSLIVSDPFRAIVRRAARASHASMMSGQGQRMVLNLTDVGVILRSALTAHPELLKKIPPRASALIGDSDEAPGGQAAVDFMRIARRSRLSALALLLVGVAASVAGVMLSPDHKRSLFRFGIGLAAVALALRLTVRFGGDVLARFPRDPAVGQAVAGLWDVFLGGLMTWAIVFGGIGLVLSAAVNSLFERVQLEEMGRAIWRWLTVPSPGTGPGLLRAISLLLVGGLTILAPRAALTILILPPALVIFFIGVRQLFRMLILALPEVEVTKAVRARAASKRSGIPLGRLLPVGFGAAVLIGLGVYYLTHMAATTSAPRTIDACNGFPELRDRRLDEVVFPTAHNAMSAADVPNWLFPNQERGIAEQLNDGIRAFLIDAHYGVPVEDKVKTVLEDEALARQKYEAALGKEGVDAAMRIRDRLIGGDEGDRAVYMCHGFCELGASALVPTLEQMRDFLVTNPNEVLIIVIQDEGVTPQDIEKCFQESGLIDFVYLGPAVRPWPTLREMVSSDQRVVVMTENAAQSVPWIHPAFELIQETPYTFKDPTEFSNKPNRGGTSASLLLLNHWIDSTPTPLPSNAEKVNAYDVLLDRARRCERERRHIPNLVAVDFYRTGDLLRVSRTLNRIPTPRSRPGG